MANLPPFIQTDQRGDQLPAGDSGIIIGFSDPALACKLLAMGVRPGQAVSLVRQSPLGGSVYLTIEGKHYALRQAEFQTILIRR